MNVNLWQKIYIPLMNIYGLHKPSVNACPGPTRMPVLYADISTQTVLTALEMYNVIIVVII